MIIVANTVDVSAVPEEIKILPVGTVSSQKGEFVVDDRSVHSIIEKFKSRKLDMVIDYEHQTLENVQAPAAGWIKDMHPAGDAIIAKVEWTERAKQYLKNKEYKYLSPVIICTKTTKHAEELHSVALTNTPAIDGMFPIVNSAKGEPIGEDTPPVIDEIKKLIGLDLKASDDELLRALSSLMQSKTDAENIVASMKFDAHQKAVDDAVQYALTTGKITAAMRESSRDWAEKDLESFKNYIASAPAVVPMGRIISNTAEKTTSESNKRINDMLGISKDDAARYGR